MPIPLRLYNCTVMEQLGFGIGSRTLAALKLNLIMRSICLALVFSQGQAVERGRLIPAADLEVDALLQFKALLSPQSQALLTGWNASNTRGVCESWVGINCTIAAPPGNEHRIYSITLSGLGLRGSVAPHLGNLTTISILDLSNNSLTGAIPSSLGSLSSLQVLHISHNDLSGHIPHSLLTNCTSLNDVALDHNSLTGSIPEQIESPLQWLGLHQNNLTGKIPPALGNCTKLINLLLYTNQLTGPIPSELGSLHSIEMIVLHENNLTGAIPRSLGNCTSLTDLILYYNFLITGSIPLELGFLRNLRKLYLFYNNLRGTIPPSLGNCTNLQILQIGENAQLTGPIPDQLGLLLHLQILKLTLIINLTGAIPRSLSNCTNLVTLLLNKNRLSGSIPTEFSRLGNLQLLVLAENHLSGSILTLSLHNFSNLVDLDLHSNELSGLIPTQLGQMQKLQYLDLGSNSFSNVIPWPILSNCSSLYELHLSNNHLHGPAFPSDAGRLQELRNLYLQNNLLEGGLIPDIMQAFNMSLVDLDLSLNRLNGSLPSSLAHVLTSSIVVLSISHNDFSGSLPPWLGELIQVEEMYLSYNHFTGTIPNLGDQCPALKILDLSHNHLSGDIPQHLANLTSLESLDVSSNNLTGVIPEFLGNLTHLQFLNVSFNNFTGIVPLRGVFEHLNASCFQGNPKLCGLVIHKACIFQHQQYSGAGQVKWKKILLIALASSIGLGAAFILALCHYLKCIQRFQGGVARGNSLLKAEVNRYTAEDLTEATQGFSEGNLLGHGALAEVYKGVLSDGKVVAVKKFKDLCFREALLQEAKILNKLRHRNLVRVLGCVLNLDINALVLEYMSNGSLEQHLHPVEDANECHELSWRVLLSIATGVANALAYLHHDFGAPIIHGDVKPSNILLDSDLVAHLADFGLAKLANDGIFSVSSSMKGSIGYMAPEYAYAARISTKVDVYSFGVVILEMLTGRRPTQLPESLNLHQWVKAKLLEGVGLEEVLLLNTNDHEQVMQLLKLGLACTQDEHNTRPTMQQVVALLHTITPRDPLISHGGTSVPQPEIWSL